MTHSGEYGGRVKQAFTTSLSGEVVKLFPGEEISPEMALNWPVTNRLTLQSTGYVEWFNREPN